MRMSMKRIASLLAAAAVAMAPVAARAASSRSARSETASLEARFVVGWSLVEMRLSDTQRQELLSIVEEGVDLVDAARGRLAELMPQQRETFGEFYETALTNSGFSPELRQRTSQLAHTELALRKQFMDEAQALAGRARDVLTERQIRELYKIAENVTGVPYAGGYRPRNRQEQAEYAAREELRRVKGALHGAMDPLGWLVASPSTARCLRIQLKQRAATSDCADTGMDLKGRLADASDPDVQYLHELRRDMVTVNLVNGLNLTREQLRVLLKEAQDVVKVCPPAPKKPTGDTAEGRRYQSYLERLVRTVERGRTPNQRELQWLHKLRVYAVKAENGGRHASPERRRHIVDTAVEAVYKSLSEEQRQVIVDYEPCLVPPKELDNPVRAGQAHDTSHYRHALDKIRRMPDDLWGRASRQTAEFAVARVEERFGRIENPTERAKAVETVHDIASRAHAMDDVEYEMNADDLAAELAFLDRKNVAREQLLAARGEERTVQDKVRTFLLNESAVRLARLRLGGELSQR